MNPLRANRGAIANLIVIAVLTFFICYPLFLLMKGSFQTGMITDPTSVFSLGNWITALSSASVNKALLNTLILVASYNAIAIPIAIVISWLLARTNIPIRGWLEFGFWISFFMPTLSIIQGWILLLDPHYGLINEAFKRWFSLSQGPFDIYTYGGIIFIHLVTVMVSGNVMLMTPAFKNMNSALEEASQIAGDSRWKTLLNIFIPVMAPSILISSILGIIRALESFEVELILGTPKRIEVYSTYIYRLIRQEQADYGLASAMGIVIMGVMFLLIFYQYRVTSRKSYTTVSGKHESRRIDLGKWKWPAFAFVFLFVLTLTFVPTVFLTMGTLMTSYGFFNLSQVWTLDHWRTVMTDNVFIGSLWNTLKLAFGTAIFTVVLCFLIAYMIVRSRMFGKKWLDVLSWVPFSTPGILYSLAFLWFVFTTPFLQPFYGSTFILILAVGSSMITLSVQMIKSSLAQFGAELEEASWTSKASWWYTIRRIVFPLSVHSIAVVGILGFVSAGKNVSHLSLLATSDNRPLAIMQLEYMLEGRYEAASIVGLIIVLVIVAVALTARKYGFNIGPKHD